MGVANSVYAKLTWGGYAQLTWSLSLVLTKVLQEAAAAVTARRSVSIPRESARNSPSPMKPPQSTLEDMVFVPVPAAATEDVPMATEQPPVEGTNQDKAVEEAPTEKRPRFKKCQGCGMRTTQCICLDNKTTMDNLAKDFVKAVRESMSQEDKPKDSPAEVPKKAKKTVQQKTSTRKAPQPKPPQPPQEELSDSETASEVYSDDLTEDESTTQKGFPMEGCASRYAHFWQEPSKLQDPQTWLESIWSEGTMDVQAYQTWLAAMNEYWEWKPNPQKPSERLRNVILYNIQMWVMYVPNPVDPDEAALMWAVTNVDQLMIQRAFDKGDAKAAQLFGARLRAQQQSDRYRPLRISTRSKRSTRKRSSATSRRTTRTRRGSKSCSA